MTGLARWCFTHKWHVLAAWLAALVVLGGISASVGTGYTDDFTLSGTESTDAFDLLRKSFPAQSNDQNQIVFAADDIQAEQSRIEATLEKVEALDAVDAVDELQVAPEGGVAFATVTMDGEQPLIDVKAADYEKLIDTAQAGAGDGLEVELGGNGIQQAQFNEQEGGGTEFLGFAAAAIILLIAFGSFFAMLLPLLTAALSLGTALSAAGLLAHLLDIATFAPQLASLIGLGVGIDYALFVVTRHRNAIKAGRTPEEACVRALSTSGRAVLFAGATVVVALMGLLVLGVSFLNGVAVAASITVLTVMAAAVTLMPAFLGMFGMRVLSRRERGRLEEEGPKDPKLEGVWPRWAAFVQRRPWPLAAVALLVMIVLAIPALDLRLGAADAGQDPSDTTTRQAYDLLAEGFGPGFNGTLQIVARTPGGEADLAKMQTLSNAIADTPGIADASPPVPAPNGEVALITARPSTAPQDAETSELIDQLRADVVPGASGGLDVSVGGITAIFDDFAVVLSDKLPEFIAVIVILGCLLLMLAFRSILIPLTAAAMNLLAAGAAFGVVTAVFQKGIGADLLGVGEGPIEPFLPVIMLAILFGLSMDYQVFLVSRMHEEWVNTKDNGVSVRVGQSATGRVITAAAAIMICVFGSFLLLGQRVIAEFGVGLAVAVLLDAFILRTILVPSVMHLIGARNWWLPRRLDRALPRIAVEGSES